MAHELLVGWLAASVAFGALPAGSLVLLLMMRLIPGAWGEQLRLCAEAGSLLVPVAALAFLPVILGMALLYPWVTHPPANAFQRFWLNPVAYPACSIAWFLAQHAIGRSLRRRAEGEAFAASGLILLVALSFLIAILWLLSLIPAFASSVFGLQYLLGIVTVAFTSLVLFRLRMRKMLPRREVIGALLLTLALFSAYFQFLPFFIGWSGNLPPDASWYAVRATTGWLMAAAFFAAAGGWPIIVLLFAAARQSRAWLMAASASMLLAKLVELAWLILPGQGSAAPAFALLVTLLLAMLAMRLLHRALLRRIAARLPRPA